jgi:hypothetical protein
MSKGSSYNPPPLNTPCKLELRYERDCNIYYVSYHVAFLISSSTIYSARYHTYHIVGLIISIAVGLNKDDVTAEFEVRRFLQHDSMTGILCSAAAITTMSVATRLSEQREPTETNHWVDVRAVIGDLKDNSEDDPHKAEANMRKLLASITKAEIEANERALLHRHIANFLHALNRLITLFEVKIRTAPYAPARSTGSGYLTEDCITATLNVLDKDNANFACHILEPFFQFSPNAPHVTPSPMTEQVTPRWDEPQNHLFDNEQAVVNQPPLGTPEWVGSTRWPSVRQQVSRAQPVSNFGEIFSQSI